MAEAFKVGIDIHGVIDAFPQKFKQLSTALVASGAEVHIVTGSKRDDRIEALLNNTGIAFTHYFSIVESLEKSGDIRWEDDQPYALEEKWNMAKRNYCEQKSIDLMIDDSPIYRDTFSDIETNFLHLTS
jgi:hypothetical protein